MSVKQLALFGSVGVLTLVGVAGGSRWRTIETRRAELNKEYEATISKLRAFDEDGLRRSDELRAKEAKAQLLHGTVDTLWADRLERYKQTNLDLHAYLLAMPEALGALKGLTNHYRYMSEEMRKFVGFDIACSKLHNLSLLLQHGRAVGFPRVAETVREMFAAEPLVTAMCDNVAQLDGIGYPRSVAEASGSFAFCIEELEAAVAAAGQRYADTLAAPAVAKTPGAVSDGVREVLRKGQLDRLSAGQRELTQRRAALDRLMAREQRQLQSEEDIRAALEYVAKVAAHFSVAPKKSVFSKEDKFLVAVQADKGVRRAVQQASLWRSSAATFIMQRQAQDALDCYQLLLAETLTKVNDLPQ